MPDVIVVGAGAAGIIAAWRAASLGKSVILLEKTARIGTKILISGGGKCNITHDGPIEEVLKEFRPNEARFLRPSLYKFTNQEVRDLFTSAGLEVYTRPNGRIFPVNGTAKDVVEILRGYLKKAGVELRIESPVTRILHENNRVNGVESLGEKLLARSVILCVGGSSYPGTGTTGDGYPWVKELGHTLVPIKAALAPMKTNPEPTGWAGVALRDAVIKARKDGKEIDRWRDDLLFTHHGVSGPTILGISRTCAENKSPDLMLHADLLPDETFETTNQRILDWCQKHPKRMIKGFVDEIVAERLVSAVLETAKVNPETIANVLPKKDRNRLVEVLKGWPLGKIKEVILDKGEVVAGGVSLDEVDPQTMASRKKDGLFLCGEILDVAGPVGGYNLQAAFSTGFVAGENA